MCLDVALWEGGVVGCFGYSNSCLFCVCVFAMVGTDS